MFEKVLIANRGEIALRVARACRELGIKSVAIYSTADAESAVVRFADEAVHVGPHHPGKSYLHIPNVIGAAQKTGADAIHPGYGFLSEDPFFAEICSDNGITFIGPRPEVMEKVGDKAIARDLMQKAGLPLLPGTIEPVQTAEEAQEIADGIGYPVIIKAVAGGGGRGMNVVRRAEDLARLYADHARHRAGRVQGQRRLHRALPRGPPPHRGAAGVRQPRQRRVLLRTRLLGAAPPPEADRGGALDPPLRRAAQRHRRARRRRRPRGRLHRRRHDGVPARPRGQPLLHGDERPHPGRAPRQRDGHVRRPDPGADPRRRRRAAIGHPGGRRAARPRDRVPRQRRGPRPRLRPGGRAPRRLRAARRAVDARRFALLPRAGTSPRSTTR